MSSNTTRVIKNTISLYLRMIILTVISLFTVRVVLSVLGETDYGLYNVVGGFVSMFAFVSGTLTISSQRYFAICLSTNDWDKLKKTFSINFVIYVALAIVILLIAETIGLMFVENVLVIPPDRMAAAIGVYHFSVINFIVVLLTSPFLALLVADENLGIYSIISVVEAIFKVLIVYLLYLAPYDKLMVYAGLLCGTSIIVNGIYVFYCLRKYKKLKIGWYWDKEEYKSLFSFLNWNLIGAIASVVKSQGVNIIINIFFGSVVNAARAIAYQVSTIITSFSQNFMKAIDPQITKTYAVGDRDSWYKVIYIASKISYFLLFIVSVPFICNMEYVFGLWLGEVPQYTIIFTILVIIDSMILAITDPIFTAIQATGKVKLYQIVVGGCNLFNLPLAYGLLMFSENPLLPFWAAIIVSSMMSLGRLYTFKRAHEFSIRNYLLNVYVPIVLTTIAVLIGNNLFFSGASSFIELIVNCIGSVIISLFAILVFGLSKMEKSMLIEYVPILKKFIRIK